MIFWNVSCRVGYFGAAAGKKTPNEFFLFVFFFCGKELMTPTRTNSFNSWWFRFVLMFFLASDIQKGPRGPSRNILAVPVEVLPPVGRFKILSPLLYVQKGPRV